MKKLISASALLMLLNTASYANTECVFGEAASCEGFDPVSQLKKRLNTEMVGVTGWCGEHKRNILVELIHMKQPETIVEIGVWGGSSLLPMAAALKQNGHGKITGIDPWKAEASVEGQTGDNLAWWQTVDHDAILAGLEGHIARLGLSSQIDLVRLKSADASVLPSIDMIHIDGNHSEEAAMGDVLKWVPQVKSGGVIVMDDVNAFETDKAVAYLDQTCIRFKIYEQRTEDGKLANYWGIWIKP